MSELELSRLFPLKCDDALGIRIYAYDFSVAFNSSKMYVLPPQLYDKV